MVNDPEKHSFWSGEDIEFFKETIKNLVIFFLIFAVAYFLSLVVQYLEKNDVNKIIIYGITIIEYAIFICDVIWFIAKLVGFTISAIKRIFREMSD